MAKTCNYFSHDAGARNDSRILRLRMKLGAAGYGIYFMILERMREEDSYELSCDYSVIAYDLHEDEDTVRAVIEDFGLFEFSQDSSERRFWSESFKRRMDKVDSISRKRAEAVAQRSDRAPKSTKTIQSHTNDLQNSDFVQQTENKSLQNPDFVPENKSKVKEKKNQSPDGEEADAHASSSASPPGKEKIFVLADAIPLWVSDTQWMEATASLVSINLDLIPSLVSIFTRICISEGKIHNNDTDARSHFSRWLQTDKGQKAIAKVSRAARPRPDPAPTQSSKPLKDPDALTGDALARHFDIQPGETIADAMARRRRETQPQFKTLKPDPDA